MGFTPSQKNAIETFGKDLLVSASAGSGKTTVLTERIVTGIKHGAELEKFLVVTFTVSAAEDLKRKLQSKLGELIKENPKDKRYKNQLYKLPCANIGTIHSFCLRIIRENFALLGLPAKLSVGDEPLFKSMQNECLEELITELCEEEDKSILLLLDHFAGPKSDSALNKTLLPLYSSIRAFPFYLKWLDSALDSLIKEKELYIKDGLYATLGGSILKTYISNSLDKLAEKALKGVQLCEADEGINRSVFEELSASIEELKKANEKSYEDLCICAPLFKARTLRKAPDELSALKKEITAGLSDIVKEYTASPAAIIKDYEDSISLFKALNRIIELFDASFTKRKREKALLDFCDIEQLFLALLVEEAPDGSYVKTELCRTLSKSIDEIFIDEYQDVSPLQDMIFKVISRGNNRFMVGDIKQSIYRFRNAYPDIFIRYKQSFAELSENKSNAKISLRENFRCSNSIIEFTNLLFSKIYTKETADTDYAGEELIYGRNSGSDLPVQVKLFTNSKESETCDEAHFIASEIERLTQETKDDGTPIKYGDIAVLMRGFSNLKTYNEVFAEHGIPCVCARSTEKLFERPEVLLVISALRVIDNPTDDISLAALMRSPVYCFSAEELALICRQPHSSLYKAVKSYAERGKLLKPGRYSLKSLEKKAFKRPSLLRASNSNRNGLSVKCAEFLESLAYYRSSALLLPAYKLIWLFYRKSGIFSYSPKGSREEHCNNLLRFYKWAKDVESGSFKGVCAFVEYLNRMTENDQSPEATDAVAEDAVKFITIHSSKGLEFPVCFVAELGKKINKESKNSAVMLDRDGGINFKLFNKTPHLTRDTLRRKCFVLKESRDLIAEELRILYVAFTRARERLYLSASLDKGLDSLTGKGVSNPDSYISIFYSLIKEAESPCFDLEVKDLSVSAVTEEPTEAEPAEESAVPNSQVEEKVEAPSEKAKPLALAEDIRLEAKAEAKLSVSMIRQDENGLFTVAEKAKGEIKRPLFASEATELTAADKGTATHLFMQFASFERAAEKGIGAEADRLLTKGFITKEQRELLNEKQIAAFLDSALYRRICASKHVFREKRFTTELSASLFSGGSNGVLIQGVVDCFFENPDGSYTLIDYKTDRVKEGEEQTLIDRHKTQLSFYAEALEKLTGKSVSEIFIYSLALGKEIKCERLSLK